MAVSDAPQEFKHPDEALQTNYTNLTPGMSSSSSKILS